MKNNKNDAVKGCTILIFLISSIFSIITGIAYAIHAFGEPYFTTTQNIIWFCSNVKLWGPWALMIISYFILYLLYLKDPKKDE